MNHQDLVTRAVYWLRNSKHCQVVFTELTGRFERADALGFRYSSSTLIEAKISRSDFFRDFKKYGRHSLHSYGRSAQYCYYLVPPQLVKPDEIPKGWGLLYCLPKQIRTIKRAEPIERDGYLFQTERIALFHALTVIQAKRNQT